MKDINEGKDKKQGERLKSFQLISERNEKRRRKASISRLIFYIISLIAIILLWLWFRRVAP